MYCLKNTRRVNTPDDDCRDNDIRITKTIYDDGKRIFAETLNIQNRERLSVRMTNRYVFGKNSAECANGDPNENENTDNTIYEIIIVWHNIISLVDVSTVIGKMKVYPKISSIWLKKNGSIVSGEILYRMTENMIKEINQIIGNNHVIVDDIHVDQFEMLLNNGIDIRSDLKFEQLLIYADTLAIASSEKIQFKREIPDDIELIIAIEKIVGGSTEGNSLSGGKKTFGVNSNVKKVKKIEYVDF